MEAALSFLDVCKEYGSWFGAERFRALDGFSLEVRRGEIFGFLGPNGAGKTTAIYLALGLKFATSGTGTMLGRPFGDAKARRKVGFLAESTAYYNRTAQETVSWYASLEGGSVLTERMREVIHQVDLEDVKNKKVNKFSRGMLQRVGLAVAIANDPELLILDEPTSALDPSSRAMVRELLLGYREQGKTIFLSSHLLSEIELVCDRVGIINHGRLARIGRVSELIESKDEFEILARVTGESIPAGGIQRQDGLTMWRVPARAQRTMIEKIWAVGGEVVSVSPVKKSLEEIFLSLTEEQAPR